MLRKSGFTFIRLLLTVTAVMLTGLSLIVPRQSLAVQDDATPTPGAASGLSTLTIAEPELNPPFAGDIYPNGWLRIFGKSAYTIYLAANTAETEAPLTGVWRPDIPLPGQYQVSVYLGIGELAEYRALYPDVFAPGVELTRSAHYQITHAQGTSTQSLDQSGRDSGWVDLGVFPFAEGTDGFITLSNQTEEAGGTAVVALSALQLTMVTPTSPPATGPTDTTTPTTAPTPAGPATATAVPQATLDSLNLLDFGEPQFAGGDEPDREDVEVPLFIAGEPVGRMTISYPADMDPNQADNITANVFVEDEFADALKVALEDETNNQVVGDVIIRSQFYLTLDAASFEFDETFKTQRLTVFQGQPAGVAWNIRPKTGIDGRQDFNVKVILRFTDGIPEVSGLPPSFSINVRGSSLATPVPAGPVQPTAVPTPPAGGRIVNNLIDNTAVLMGACLTFIVGILGVVIAYLNYRKDKSTPSPDAPAVLDNQRQIQLHRWLDEYFNEQELRSLCLEIGVDYDDLRFSGQANKARELVGWCARNGRLDDLAAKIREVRPRLSE